MKKLLVFFAAALVDALLLVLTQIPAGHADPAGRSSVRPHAVPSTHSATGTRYLLFGSDNITFGSDKLIF
jgi:hypothetical protein